MHKTKIDICLSERRNRILQQINRVGASWLFRRGLGGSQRTRVLCSPLTKPFNKLISPLLLKDGRARAAARFMLTASRRDQSRRNQPEHTWSYTAAAFGWTTALGLNDSVWNRLTLSARTYLVHWMTPGSYSTTP